MAITAFAPLFLTGILPLTGIMIGSEQAEAKVQNGALSLKLTKTTNQGTVERGQLITYHITVKNTGTIKVENVRVRDHVPSKLTYVPKSSSIECGMPAIGNMVLCGPITLKPGKSHSFSLVYRVDDSAICGSKILNRAHAMFKLLTLSDAYVTSTVSCTSSSSSAMSKSSRSMTSSSYSSSSVSSSPSSSSSSMISSSSSSKSSKNSSYSSSSHVGGCIDILKEAFDPYGNKLPVVPAFTFSLEDGRTAVNDSSGYARFDHVPAGSQLVMEEVPTGWSQFLVTPANSRVYVTAGSNCVGIVFKNIQALPTLSSSSAISSSSSAVSSSSSSRSSFHCNYCLPSSSSSKSYIHPCDCDCHCPDGNSNQNVNVNSDADTDVHIDVDANTGSNVNIDQNADDDSDQNVTGDSDANTDVHVNIHANSQSDVDVDQKTNTNEESHLWFRLRSRQGSGVDNEIQLQSANAQQPSIHLASAVKNPALLAAADDDTVGSSIDHEDSTQSSIPLIVFITISTLGLIGGAFGGFRWFI